MHTTGHPYSPLSPTEIVLIHRSALRLLSEMGMVVQHQRLLQSLAECGLPVDFEAERVRFPAPFVERFIAEAKKYDWEQARPSVSASAGVYHSLYHDPCSKQLIPWTEENLAFYFALANQLPHIGSVSMLGCRLPVPATLEPLYERYYCWKYGAAEGSSIYLDELCPYLLELYRVKAEAVGQPMAEVFRGTVFLIPALKLGRHEAYQVDYFREHGIRVHIGGSMFSMGANAPATLVGAVTLNLAEQLALRILDWALFEAGKTPASPEASFPQLFLHTSISVLDMRTTIRPFGRPEMTVANLMTAQLARHYGAAFGGHAGLTDSMLPSVESGAQKSLSAIATLMAGGNVWLDAGLLGIDEVCSPIQLILDDELVSALKVFTHEFEISEEAIGLETILEAGPAGQYLDKPHTARYFRQEHWNPSLWNRRMLSAWQSEGALLDVDKARQLALEVQKQGRSPSAMADALEREILIIIEKAKQRITA